MALHQPVLLNECLEGLAIKPNGLYVDGTFGRGGHCREILKQLDQSGRVIAFDKDLEAIRYAKENFSGEKRLTLHHASFSQLKAIAEKEDVVGKVDGVLLDLGVSSPQIDNPERGFSFLQKGPLDMRMDATQTLSAARFVNTASEKEMSELIKKFGEERFAGRISRAIVRERTLAPIETTDQLAQIVKEANPKWEKHKHPATRVFQAIRIHVNQELNDLLTLLDQCMDVLAPKGRLVVISFHSLEDRIVKKFMRDKEKGPQVPKEIPIEVEALKGRFKRVGKAIKPNEVEVHHNVRARSAVLRIGEKLT